MSHRKLKHPNVGNDLFVREQSLVTTLKHLRAERLWFAIAIKQLWKVAIVGRTYGMITCTEPVYVKFNVGAS